MKLKNNILFRLEYFGGIIISKVDFQRTELSFSEALFIEALNYVQPEQATRIVCDILNIDSIDMSRLDSLNIFEEETSLNTDYNYAKSIVQKKYNDVKQKHFLSFPLEIAIYPSMKCNLKCRFCFVGSKMDSQIYDANHWGNLLAEAKKQGLLSVSILGGEPSLYYDIDSLLLKCEELELNTVITTNALTWKNSTKQIVLHAKHITPVVSMQSLDNLNCLLMGCDSREQIKFIEEFLAYGKDIRVNSVYTFQTVEQILKIFDYCKSVGIRRYSVANYSNVKDNTEMKYAHTLSDLAELDRIVKQYIKEKYPKDKNIPVFSAEGCMLYLCYASQVTEELQFSPFEEQYFGCRGKYTKMEIYSDGTVYPCCRYETIIPSTSNAFKSGETLKYIWENDYNYKNLRVQETKNSVCLKCSFLKICQGGCYPSRVKMDKATANEIRDPNCQLIIKEYLK